jgi:gas vesicle protein
MSTSKVLLGVLAGAAAGAAIGILFAPEKGSETRRRIMKKGDDYSQEFKDRFEEWSENGAEKIESFKNGARDLADRGRAKAEDVKRDLKTS